VTVSEYSISTGNLKNDGKGKNNKYIEKKKASKANNIWWGVSPTYLEAKTVIY